MFLDNWGEDKDMTEQPHRDKEVLCSNCLHQREEHGWRRPSVLCSLEAYNKNYVSGVINYVHCFRKNPNGECADYEEAGFWKSIKKLFGTPIKVKIISNKKYDVPKAFPSGGSAVISGRKNSYTITCIS